MLPRISGALVSLVGLTLAAQPSAPVPSPAPLRQLPWGQLNFLHTTDTHGWHGGHLQEAQYSGDWGDYVSFAQRLRERADKDGSDLLLIDTGDRIEGNGLFDASDPKGEYTYDIFKHQHIDIITPGNHELYQPESSNNEFYETVPNYKENYLASNLDIYNPETGEREPLARRYRKFTTKNQGIRITAFGFLFDFHGNANNTVVIPVEEAIKQTWFLDAIHDHDVDLFVVAGHVPVRDSPEYTAVHKAIRSVNKHVPIQFFGGHTHIRDYVIYDDRAVGLESGRYMETIGFQSISGISTKSATTKSPTFERLYIDNNLFSFHNHSGLNSATFPTREGVEVSHAIAEARKALDLDSAYGCAPQTYWLSRAPYPSRDSLISLLDTRVLPDIAKTVSTRTAATRPAIIMTNTGTIRFDVFKGPFTIDTTFLISPFVSGLRRLKDVKYDRANKILRLLNNQGPITIDALIALSYNEVEHDHHDAAAYETQMTRLLSPPVPPVKLARSSVRSNHRHVYPVSSGQQVLSSPVDFDSAAVDAVSRLTPGYTTIDDASSTSPGDDTIHEPIKFYEMPNAVGANVEIDEGDPPDTVDLIYNEFIESWILLALRFLGERRDGPGEVLADGRSFSSLLSGWIAENWPCDQ